MKIGIDYSMTSPGICISIDSKIHMIGISSKKKEVGSYQLTDNILLEVKEYPKTYKNNFERFKLLAKHTMDAIKIYNPPEINIEGYSMGSRAGQVFTIAENTTILKMKLLENKISINIVSPTGLKKSATGKGNANKDLMISTFLEKFGIEDPKLSCFNDCVDAYFLTQYIGEFYEILN